MKLVLITDTHWGARQDNAVILDYFSKFYSDVFFPYIDEHQIKTVIHLGDVFDRRKYTNHLTLKKAREAMFDPMKERGLDVLVTLGNHDSTYRNTLDVNSPNLLLNDYDFKIYREASYVDFGDLKILLVPWITPENQTKTMEMIEEAKAKIIMGHLEIRGYEMLRGRPCEHGMESSLFDPYLSVFSGHFHYKSYSSGIMYLGTPYEMTWADYGAPKGFHVLDTETLEIEFVENPLKLFTKVFYNDSESEPTFDADALNGAYVKVIVQNKNNPSLFEKFMDKINRTNATNVIVVEEPLFKPEILADGGEIEIEDTLTFMTKYIKNMDNISGDRNNIVKLIDDLYHRANMLEI